MNQPRNQNFSFPRYLENPTLFLRLFEDCEMRPEFINSQSLTKLDPN